MKPAYYSIAYNCAVVYQKCGFSRSGGTGYLTNEIIIK